MARPSSFRQHILQVREDAIVASVYRLLAEKGFDAMTVDEVAADVGIAKASLYKHFSSKEALAAAAMVKMLERAQAMLDQVAAQTELSPLERLRAVAHWCLSTQLAGEMPSLPAENSTLRAVLMRDEGYLGHVMAVSDRVGAWIEAAQAAGQVNPALPAEMILFTLYARACDPVPGFLRATQRYDDETILAMSLAACFEGLAA